MAEAENGMDKVQVELAAEDYEALQTAINSPPQPNDKLVELMKGSQTVAEGMKEMSEKIEQVKKAVRDEWGWRLCKLNGYFERPCEHGSICACLDVARAAIAAADKWDAEQRQPEISAGQDAAIQDELDHPPASIMEEGK
jgi:hypothetical protein